MQPLDRPTFTTRRHAAAALLALGTLAIAPVPAFAQAWPSRPIKLIVPFPPGGGTDVIAREVTHKVGTANGWTFVIENKPGSGGNLGVDAAAKSAPDGYTLVLGQTSNLTINPALYSKLPYSVEKDLAPIVYLASSPVAIAVPTASPFKTLADVLAAAKAKPDSLTFGSSGNGTVSHLAMELLQRTANVKLTHVPYKGASHGINDLIGGQIDMYVSSVPTLIGHVRNGKMRVVAVTSAKRTNDLPTVPTVSEAGHPGFEALTWFGISGPSGIPKDVVAKLNTAFNQALKDPDIKTKLADQGLDITGGTPERFGDHIRTETIRWSKVIKEAGVKLD